MPRKKNTQIQVRYSTPFNPLSDQEKLVNINTLEDETDRKWYLKVYKAYKILSELFEEGDADYVESMLGIGEAEPYSILTRRKISANQRLGSIDTIPSMKDPVYPKLREAAKDVQH